MTIVVALLMTSCHVSVLGNNGNDAAQTKTSRRQPTKNGARLVRPAAVPATRSNGEVICASSHVERFPGHLPRHGLPRGYSR